MSDQLAKYKEALPDNEQLKTFLRNVREFDELFCDLMNRGADFTLSLEVRANKKEGVVQCHTRYDKFDRPSKPNRSG